MQFSGYRQYGPIFLLWAIILILGGCTGMLDHAPSGDAEAIQGAVATPTPDPVIAGLIIRCGQQSRGNNSFELTCHLYSVGANGSSTILTSVPSSLTVNWDVPTAAGTTVQVISCSVQTGGVSETCQIETSDSTIPTIEVTATVIDQTSGQSGTISNDPSTSDSGASGNSFTPTPTPTVAPPVNLVASNGNNASGTSKTSETSSPSATAQTTPTPAPAAPTPTPTPAPSTCGELLPGQSLVIGQSIKSCNGQYELILQDDGNLAEYGPSGAMWSTHTGPTGNVPPPGYGGTGNLAIMQDDGNFVLYNNTSPTWNTITMGNSGSHLALQGDGNIVIYTPGNQALWSEYTGSASLAP